MGFYTSLVALAISIAGDLTLLVMRPTWTNGAGEQDPVADYILLAVHYFFAVVEAIVTFSFLANTIWFTAGLLRDLGRTIQVTFPFYILHLLFIALPWGYRISAAQTGYTENVFFALYIIEQLVSVATWLAMFYTAFSVSEPTMYPPYHREVVAAELSIMPPVDMPSDSLATNAADRGA